MSKYVVAGAGGIGSAVATRLASEGHDVTLVSRRGGGPSHPLIARTSADVGDTQRLIELSANADAVFNCVNPPYHRWANDWPPLATSLLQSAASSNAVLVTLSNLYAYGVPTGPMSPSSPFLATYDKALVRATMWHDALAAHHEGRLRTCEVRASDFLGISDQSMLGERVVPRVLAGKSCQVLGNPDMAHSWSYTDDVANTLIACAQNSLAWGRAWHAVTNPPRSTREAINDIADVAGCDHVKVKSIPTLALRALGIFNPTIRELPITSYQFEMPFIIDDVETREELGLTPTPWREALAATIEGYK
jgi:nucleoside-diphosphate-sugar epimerase